MSAITETERPRAFDPAIKAGQEAPAAPGWDLGPERRIDDGQTLATGLAWFSIGLGAMEVFATDSLCDYLGMEDRKQVVHLMGLREIASGIGILSQRRPTGWIAGRIAGDALDLALLVSALDDNRRRRR